MITRRTAILGAAAVPLAMSVPALAMSVPSLDIEADSENDYRIQYWSMRQNQIHLYRGTTNYVTTDCVRDFGTCYDIRWSEFNRVVVDRYLAFGNKHTLEPFFVTLNRLDVEMRFDSYPGAQDALDAGFIPAHHFHIRKNRG